MIGIGICIGASTVSIVKIRRSSPSKVMSAVSIPHEGDPRAVLERALAGLPEDALLLVTGRKFKDLLALPNVPEPEAVEAAYHFSAKGRI